MSSGSSLCGRRKRRIERRGKKGKGKSRTERKRKFVAVVPACGVKGRAGVIGGASGWSAG